MAIFNEGDTCSVILNFTVNGEALTEGAYDEIEFQFNPQSVYRSVKKLLSDGDIIWTTVSYLNDGEEESFTGYVVNLSQEDTFKIGRGETRFQIRIKIGDNVGSCTINNVEVGDALSEDVL